MHTRSLLAIGLCLAAAAIAQGCHGGAADSDPGTAGEQDGGGEDAGGTTDPDAPDGAVHAYWRVDVVGTAAGATIHAVHSFSSTMVVVPAAAADFMVVARSGGDAVQVQPVRFPTEILEEYDDDRNATTLVAERAHEVVYLERAADVDSIELVGPDGTVLDERAPPAELQDDGTTGDDGFRALKLPSRYEHIVVLSPEQRDWLPPQLSDRIADIVPLSDAGMQALIDGFDLAAPAVVSAVRTVAVVDYLDPESAPIASTWGSSFVINADWIDADTLPGTIVHESAHNYHFLLDTADTPEPYDRWPAALRDHAMALAERFAFSRGLPQIWYQMHDSAARYGLAASYLGSEWPGASNADAVDGGFASAYGRRHWGEDIAEYVETVQAPQYGRGACPRFDGGTQVSEDNAITFVKLTLLHGVGAIETSNFEQCVGNAAIDDTPGIYLGDGILTLNRNMDAGYTEYEGVSWFAMVAEDGEGYGVAVRVHAPNGDDALGMHRLDTIALGRSWTELAGVFVDHENPIYARGSGEGLVVITEASTERTRGVVLGLTLLNAFGEETDYLPVSPFNVPVQ